MDHVSWEKVDRTYTSVLVGKIGRVTAFEVAWDGVSRLRPEKYRLTTRLPLNLKHTRFITEEAAQECAGRVANEFVRMLGAEFKEAPSE